MERMWPRIKLGKVCLIERGGSPRPITDYITDSPYGINWIKIGDAVEGSKYIYSTAERIKPEGVRKSRLVHKGDFILSNSMSFGKPYILEVDGCIHDGWLVIRDSENIFEKSFLYYYLGSPFMYQQFNKLAAGGVVKNLNSDLVRNVEVVIPPKNEQENIAHELDLIAQIIDSKNAQVRDLDALAHSIFYEMFGNPVTNDQLWLTAKLKDIAPQKVFNGSIPKKDGKSWLLNLDMVEAQTGDVLEKKYFTDEEIGNSTTTFNEDNVLYSKLRPYLNKVVMPDEPGYCTTELVPLAPVPNALDRCFITYLLRSKFFVDYISGRVAGAKMPRVSMSDFRAFDVITPPIQMQREFAEKVQKIQANKREIKASLKDAESLFSSRLDYYFNE